MKPQTLRFNGGVIRLIAPAARPRQTKTLATAADLRHAASALLAAPPTADTYAVLGAAGDLEIRAAKLESMTTDDPIVALEAARLVANMRAASPAA